MTPGSDVAAVGETDAASQTDSAILAFLQATVGTWLLLNAIAR